MISELAQLGLGIYDAIMAGQYANTKRPAYEIPEAAKTSLANAQAFSTQKHALADAMLPSLESSSAESAANLIDASPSSAAVVGGIGKLDANTNAALRAIEAMDYKAHVANQQAYRNELGNMATQQGNKWSWDKAQPYLQAMAASKMFEDSARGNIMGGIGGIDNESQKLASMFSSGGGSDSGKSGADMGTMMKIMSMFAG